jgi:fused signal recognition particle receptor
MFGFLRRKKTPPPDTVQDTVDVATHTATASVETASVETEAPVAVQVAPVEETAVVLTTPSRTGWMTKLKGGLSKTSNSITGIFNRTKVDEQLLEELEDALLMSDAGVEATAAMLDELKIQVKAQKVQTPAQVRDILRQIVSNTLKPFEAPLDVDRASPLVMMMTGVNGAGKTTSIGKLTRHLQSLQKSVLLAAGDTFRAAAREQLAQWGERNNVQVIAQDGGDPAAVAFDAVSAGIARKIDVVMIDTAGRLPTQTHLMEELKKIRRVLTKATPPGSTTPFPHERLLVLDGNTGQNMLAQVRAFHEAIDLTGLIVTKLDGTAKGGALLALAHIYRAKPIPVYFIGVGEGVDDLESFSADEFAQALI